MDNSNDKLESLEHTLNTLRFQQQRINTELGRISGEIEALKKINVSTSNVIDPQLPVTSNSSVYTQTVPDRPSVLFEKRAASFQKFAFGKTIPSKELEGIIGTNIINKIGILITIIGVFIGVKYAIDKDLISPAMRVLLGYALAAGLLLIAQRLKAKYLDFSSVMMSGGVTILYFTTFIAYDFYELFPQWIAFLAMVATTAFVVRMALVYDRKIIALLGQVGAYAIPFLLSDGSGKVLVLFAYISIINIGLLVLSVKKDWKLIYQFAFFSSWIIYLITLIVSRPTAQGFALPFAFLAINFLTFYAAFLSYKVVKGELYQLREIIILLINAFAFFLIGYNFISWSFTDHHPLTIFTIANACLHIAAGIWIQKKKLADATVSLFVLGLGISFITITIPVAFADTWITLFWVIETTILCYIGYRSGRALYLVASFACFILTLFSLWIDWGVHYQLVIVNNLTTNHTHPFLNLNFINSLFVCGCLGWMSWLAGRSQQKIQGWTNSVFTIIVPLFFIGLLYLTGFLEIHMWWASAVTHAGYAGQGNFEILSGIMYSQLYISAWLLVNWLYIKDKNLAAIMAIATIVSTLIFLIGGLNAIGDIREFYLHSHNGPAVWMVTIRYLCFALLAVQMILLRKTQRSFLNDPWENKAYAMLLNLVLLTFACNEFIHWMDVYGYKNQYKLGLSIICGLYALALVTIGILKNEKHLRVSAMVLFGGTLVKLFFYDLVSLSTISKTIVLIILGVILLIASFLYNKFKTALFDEE